MPSRAAFAPGAFPIGFAGLGLFPDSEIQRTLLFVVDVDAGAGFKVFDVLTGQAAVMGEFFHGVVHVAVDIVGEAFIDKGLNHVDDFRDRVGDTGVHVSAADAQRVGVGEIFFDVFVCDFFGGAVFFVGTVDDFIVDVGEILNEGHIVADVFEIAAQHVEHDKGSGVADVKIIVDRRAAGIHFDFPSFDGFKGFLAVGHRVV